jgi:hypothetical protein
MMHLHKAILVFAAAGFLCSTHAHSQQYAPNATQCLREYYDRSNYNWLTYENTCSQPVYVTLVGRNGTYTGGLDLAPGRHDGPGMSAQEVNAVGGMEAYACPAHYAAVDSDDELIRSVAVAGFRCKRNY